MQWTSCDAKETIVGCAKTLRDRVYNAIAFSGPNGCTDEEIQDCLEMNPSTERPRRIELQMRQQIKNSGKTRKTKSGRQAIVWILSNPQMMLF